MILPSKHVNFSESLLGFGSYILRQLDESLTVDELWKKYQTDYKMKRYPAQHSFDSLLLTITFLHTIGLIEEYQGGVKKCI